jgi:ribosomal protein S18 acetylase RimI-like enzyme
VLKNRNVVGCLVAEEIAHAYPIRRSPSSGEEIQSRSATGSERCHHDRIAEDSSSAQPTDGGIAEEECNAAAVDVDDDDDVVTCEATARPASVGISRIWVHANHRRRGIARCLLDALR